MPRVQLGDTWNDWGIALIVAIAIDAFAIAVSLLRRPDGAYLHGFGRTWRAGQGWRRDEPDQTVASR